MIQTLAVSLSLKNTYQVNCIMYAIKQTPIINRFLPDDFYGAYKVKLFANVLSILWEIMSTFAVKLLYFGAMLIWAMCFYPAATKPQLFFHILLFLTVLGSFTNTYIWSPSFLFFMMYLVNRGGSFTKALYMNCDYSLLNYNFFKKSDLVFKLFIIRLRELIKINILPALSIGMGLGVIMYANGIGKVTDYILWILLAMCLSAFFSVHYLLMYYLLQPYTSGTDVKSGHYRILEIAPFFIFLRVIKIKISSIFLGVISIGMCVLYYFIAISLVRKYSTDTFRQRV